MPKDSKKSELFDRSPEETDAAWQAFSIYRDLGPDRTQNAAWKTYAASRGLNPRAASSGFRSWLERHQWRTRAQAWDRVHFSEMVPAEGVADRLLHHRDDLIDHAVSVAKGVKELTKEQASVLNKLLDKILVVSTSSASGTTYNAPVQINVGNMNPKELDSLIGKLKSASK